LPLSYEKQTATVAVFFRKQRKIKQNNKNILLLAKKKTNKPVRSNFFKFFNRSINYRRTFLFNQAVWGRVFAYTRLKRNSWFNKNFVNNINRLFLYSRTAQQRPAKFSKLLVSYNLFAKFYQSVLFSAKYKRVRNRFKFFFSGNKYLKKKKIYIDTKRFRFSRLLRRRGHSKRLHFILSEKLKFSFRFYFHRLGSKRWVRRLKSVMNSLKLKLVN